MQTRRGTLLGKRAHHESASSTSSSASSPAPSCDQLQTPDNSPNPKRPRTSLTLETDGSNKENIPPLRDGSINGDGTPTRRTRGLRRTSTEIITPTRRHPGIQRSVSVSSMPPATPSVEIAALTLTTPPPSPPTALLPLHSRIRALLRSTCNNSDTQIAGRDTERATILGSLAPFIEGTCMNDDKGQSSMFISGTPGTGKTALVNAIIRQLSAEHSGEVRVISINCMALKSVDALWERLLEELSDAPKKRSASKKVKGREAVKSLLNTLNTKCILILDELDHITPNEASLSSIFSLTETLPSMLRLIGIANTHTLTSSFSNAFLTSANVQTIHFAPYAPAQLLEILQSRLSSLPSGDGSSDIAANIKKFLPNPTLMLLAKKVAALTGDVRSLFEVLRGAIDLAVGAASKKSSDANPLNTPPPSVTPQHVLAALKAYTPASAAPKTAVAASSTITNTSNSETVTKIQNLGLQARVVLLAILLASKRREAGLSLSASTSASPKKPSASPMKRSFSMPSPSTTGPGIGIDTSSLHTYYGTVLSRTENEIFEPVSRSEFGDLLGVLEGTGLVSLSSSTGAPKAKKAFGRSASFGAGLTKNGVGAVGEVRLVEGLWGDEVLRGLGVTSDATPTDPREEEVRGVWEREKSRLLKDVKASAVASSKNSNLDVFAGAFHD